MKSLRSLANRITNEMFTNGAKQSATRLILADDKTGRDLGGWGVGPFRDRVQQILKEQLKGYTIVRKDRQTK